MKMRSETVICFEELANGSMKKNKLERHLRTKHPQFLWKNRPFFERKLESLGQQKSALEKSVKSDKGTLRASYLISLKVAKAKKPFTTGEKLVLPRAKDIIREVSMIFENC